MEAFDGVDLESLVVQDGPAVSRSCRQAADSSHLPFAGRNDPRCAALVHRTSSRPTSSSAAWPDELDIVKVLDFGLVRTVSQDDPTRKTTSSLLSWQAKPGSPKESAAACPRRRVQLGPEGAPPATRAGRDGNDPVHGSRSKPPAVKSTRAPISTSLGGARLLALWQLPRPVFPGERWR